MTRPSFLRAQLTEIKSFARQILGLPDPWKQFRRFEKRIHPDTWLRQAEILKTCALAAERFSENETPEAYAADSSPLVRRSFELRAKVKKQFQNTYCDRRPQVRLLSAMLGYDIALGGASLYHNFAEGFRFLGVETDLWTVGSPLAPHFHSFKPNVLLAIDSIEFSPEKYLGQIDWQAVQTYRKDNDLKIGLQLQPYPQDMQAIRAKIDRAAQLGIDFFYAFQCEEFIRSQYAPWIARGFTVIGIEFGANPLVYYPVPGIKRDIDYIFLGSSNGEKWKRYFDYFNAVLSERPGIIVGPGWSRAQETLISGPIQRYLYARGGIGLNLHVPFQMETACEINERTYNLAASGIPQLCDAPKLLAQRFSARSLFVAHSPGEYETLFKRALRSPDEAEERAANALEEVFDRYTVFHRANEFLEKLTDNVFKAGR